MTLLRAAIDNLRGKALEERLPQSMGGGRMFVPTAGGPMPATQQQAMAAFGGVGWLFAVVDRIASSTAKIDWQVYNEPPGGNRREVPEHPMAKLWAKPNPFYTRAELVETSQQHFELVGEIWWVLLRGAGGAIQEIWPVRPDRMRPIPHRTEFIAGYEYRLGADVVPLALEDVIFLRRPNPLDPYRGIGPVQAIMSDLDSERFSAAWQRNFFLNSAEPGGIIEVAEGLTDLEFETMVARWREQHQGLANAHRVAILEKGKWVDRKFSMRDLRFDALREKNRDNILGAFGMPKHILGITEDVNRANAEASEVVFGRWLLKPRLERLKDGLNENLAPKFGDNLSFDFTDPTPRDRELEGKLGVDGWEAGLLTKNEGRDLLGLDEVAGGDGFNPMAGFKAVGPERSKQQADPLEDAEATMRAAWGRRLDAEEQRIEDAIEERW